MTAIVTPVASFRAALLDRRAELRRSMRIDHVQVEQHPDPMDQAKAIDARDDAARELERQRKTLAAVDAALLRLDRGEFGECLDCESPIPRKRLEAMPWAALCVRCQEEVETRGTAVEDVDEG